MKKICLPFFLFLMLMFSCDIIFNSFNANKFKGTYSIELKEFFESTKGLDASEKILSAIAKMAMNDCEIIFTFSDNNKGTFQLKGAAVDMLSLISNGAGEPKNMSYIFKSDSILMINLNGEKKEDYKKIGVVRKYDSNYNNITIFVQDDNVSSVGKLIHMRRI
jgi:hypothetical protein